MCPQYAEHLYHRHRVVYMKRTSNRRFQMSRFVFRGRSLCSSSVAARGIKTLLPSTYMRIDHYDLCFVLYDSLF